MKKILYLSPQNVIPAVDGGKIGIYYPIKALAENYELYFAFIGKCDKKTIQEYRKINVIPISFDIDTDDKPIMLMRNILTNTPFKMEKYYSNIFFQKLLEIVKTKNINIVISSHPHMAKYAIKLKKEYPALKIVLREHNVEYELVEEFYQYEKNFLKKYIAFWQYIKTKKYEINLWKKFDEVVFISENDKQEASKHINIHEERYKIVYDGFDIGCNSIKSEKEPNSFIFSGSLKTVQNKINLNLFINTIWKKIVKKENGLKLYITGNEDETFFNNLNLTKQEIKDLNIVNLGFVDDIDKVISSKTFFVSPTYIGSGIRIKVLHALSLGMVVFVSQKDYKMVKYFRDLENIVVFRDYNEFIKKLDILHRNKYLKKKISINAKKLIQNDLNWDNYFRTFSKEIIR